MSKIFDALRKAELSKGQPRRKPLKGKPAKNASGREDLFLKSVNADFRRSLMNLRNSIDSEMKAREHRVIMFTSAVKGEGKTIITAYLARILAMGSSEKILVVDCAVNNPQMHELFGVPNERGILNFLSGNMELPDVVQELDPGVLDIVTAGPVKSADITQPLFNSERMGQFINHVNELYDYVLIDTSAILEAPETPIIGSYSSGIVIVIQAGKTKREVIKRAMLMMQKLDGEFIGSVLNRKKYYIPEFIYRRV